MVDGFRDAGVFTTTKDPADRRRAVIRIAPTMRRDIFHTRGARPIGTALAHVLDNDSDRTRRAMALLEELAAHLLDGG